MREPTYFVLASLLDGPRHGYAIIREIEAHTSGHVRLRTGTLYTLLQRLLDERLIEESEARPTAGDDTRRRYYALTSLGRSVLTAEAHRLEGLVGAARRKGVLGRSRG